MEIGIHLSAIFWDDEMDFRLSEQTEWKNRSSQSQTNLVKLVSKCAIWEFEILMYFKSGVYVNIVIQLLPEFSKLINFVNGFKSNELVMGTWELTNRIAMRFGKYWLRFDEIRDAFWFHTSNICTSELLFPITWVILSVNWRIFVGSSSFFIVAKQL